MPAWLMGRGRGNRRVAERSRRRINITPSALLRPARVLRRYKEDQGSHPWWEKS